MTASGAVLRTRVDEVGNGLRAVDGGGRIIRVVEEDQPGSRRGGDHALDVQLEGGVDRHFLERPVEALGDGRRVLERRRRGDEPSLAGRERADGVPQDLLRPGAEHDVLRFDLVMRRDRGDETAVGRCAVEGIAAGLGELAGDGVEHLAARSERVLVAAEADLGDARRQRRTGLPPLRLQVGNVSLMAARCEQRRSPRERVSFNEGTEKCTACLAHRGLSFRSAAGLYASERKVVKLERQPSAPASC